MKPNLFFLFLIFLSACIFSCTTREKQAVVPPPASHAYAAPLGLIEDASLLMKEGDLLLRRGQEFSSQLISRFSKKDQTYSHAGLVFFEDGYPIVYHILPGDQNPDEKLRKDSLSAFFNPRKNSGFAIYRYQLDAAQISILKQTVYEWYGQGVTFDHEFSLNSNGRMYCSEMIRKGLMQATNHQLVLSTTKATKAEAEIFSRHTHIAPSKVINNDIVAIDNLFLHPKCRLIKRFDFQP